MQLTLPCMAIDAVAKVGHFEGLILQHEQVHVKTEHLIHAGMYCRTVRVAKGTIFTGALVKIATVVIVMGDVVAYIGGAPLHLMGYHVLPAGAGRKQAFVAKEDTVITMMFATTATNVDEAEKQFTNDYASLMSNKDDNSNEVLVTGV